MTAVMEEVLGQVTNVSQLQDVSPGDWAMKGAKSCERYAASPVILMAPSGAIAP